MSLQEAAPAPAGSEEHVSVVEVPNAPDKLNSVRAAAKLLAEHRIALRKESEQPPAEAAPEAAAPPEEIPDEGIDPAPENQEPQAETQAPDPAPEPERTIEPPRSWTTEDKETFKALPPVTQARLVELDRARELEVRKVQNESAEQRKAFDAERGKVEQARQQYEAALPVLLQTLQSTGEFADIKTIDDASRLATEDWPRWVQWRAHQDKVQAVHQELIQAQQRQTQEQDQNWSQWAEKEDQAFAEAVPEIADPEKGQKLRLSAITTLKDIGFSENELRQLWNTPAFRDHRMQKLIVDATKVREAREKQKLAPPPAKPVPPVQRPGVARPTGARLSEQIQTLDQKLNQTGSVKAAAELLMAQRKAARR